MVRLAYSVPEVAKLIGISKSKIWELIRSGELSSVCTANDSPPPRGTVATIARGSWA